VIATFLGKCLALNNFRRQLGSDLRGIKEAEVPLRRKPHHDDHVDALLTNSVDDDIGRRQQRQLTILTLTAPNVIVDAIRQQGVNMIIMVRFSTSGYGRFSIDGLVEPPGIRNRQFLEEHLG
jgi:stage V sporulation protein B